MYFTIDAGPNIHLLYPDFAKKDVEDFIQQECLDLLENKTFYLDSVGNGARIL
jgi:diphosphomevalonate decarboxylase